MFQSYSTSLTFSLIHLSCFHCLIFSTRPCISPSHALQDVLSSSASRDECTLVFDVDDWHTGHRMCLCWRSKYIGYGSRKRRDNFTWSEFCWRLELVSASAVVDYARCQVLDLRVGGQHLFERRRHCLINTSNPIPDH